MSRPRRSKLRENGTRNSSASSFVETRPRPVWRGGARFTISAPASQSSRLPCAERTSLSSISNISCRREIRKLMGTVLQRMGGLFDTCYAGQRYALRPVRDLWSAHAIEAGTQILDGLFDYRYGERGDHGDSFPCAGKEFPGEFFDVAQRCPGGWPHRMAGHKKRPRRQDEGVLWGRRSGTRSGTQYGSGVCRPPLVAPAWAWFSRAAKVSGSRPRMKYRTPQVWIKARTQDRIPAACVTIGEKSP